MLTRIYKAKRQSDLPFYCNPALLFIAVWLVMLCSLGFQISDVSYPEISLPLLVFAASLLSFLAGYCLTRAICWNRVESRPITCYQIDITRLRKFILFLACSASAVNIYNIATSGLPPVLSLLGVETLSVNDYGRLKQLMGPLLMALFVIALLDTSVARRILWALFAFLSMLSYVARGGLMLMLFQALVVLSIRSTMSKRRIYIGALAGLVVAAAFFGVLGSYRTTDAVLFAGMKIKTEFQQWPTVYVWIISYISTPLSNLCWLIKLAHFDRIHWSFTYTMLPAFWSPASPYSDIIQTTRIVDGTHTYLANYFLDFSYFGVFAVNCFMGIVSGVGSIANRIGRRFLFWSAILSCIAFMFFWDFFAVLSTLILLGVYACGQRYFIRGYSPRLVGALRTPGADGHVTI
jgi:oligosaccharide repeat unit polymerase